jgi:hypothetical protein
MGSGLFQDETAVWMVRLTGVSAQTGKARSASATGGGRAFGSDDSRGTSHPDGSTYYGVKAGRGGKKARRRAEAYLWSLETMPKPD